MQGSRPILQLILLCLLASGLALPQDAPRIGLADQIRQADALQEKGDLPQARKIYESALQELRSKGGSPRLGYVLNSLSQLASSEGNYDEAIAMAQQAADVYRQLGDKKQEASALNYRGIAEVQRGFYRAAQSSLTRALDLSRSAGDLESQTRILNNLGTADYFPGNYLQALRSYETARAIVDQNSELSWSAYWRQITDINEATVYQRLGRYQRALEIYRNVESSSKTLTSGDRAHLLTNLGALYRRLGDAWKALDQYQSALNLYSGQRDADGEISTLKNIGIVYALDQRDFDQAQKYFVRALHRATQTHNQREEMQGHLYLGETFLRKGALQASQAEFDLALKQGRQLGTTEEQWKSLYGSGKAKELSGASAEAEGNYREAISIIETSRSQLQLSALRAEFFADKRDAFDALIALLLKKNDISEAFAILEKSRARTFQDRLSSSAQAPSLAEVRGLLDDSTILLEFWTSDDQLALIWCTRDAAGVVTNQLSSEDLRQTLDFAKGLPGNLNGDWRQPAQALSRLLRGGLPLPPHIHRALIVPDGWLSSVPLDLLPTGESGELLIERLDITYLPTAALLRQANRGGDAVRFPWNRELVAFGAPQVQRTPWASIDADRESSGQSLPYSAEEIRTIAAMTAGKAGLLLGASDLRSAFLANAATSPLLHVSTHAFADADNPENSRILFSPETPGGEPDYVFLRELYALDLSGLDLATLSACDTERGKIIRGEGVQAFSRALLSAGARSALTTLWRVDDQATNEFMKQFYYFALEKRQPKAQALRSAKLKFLRSGTPLANPSYWAGFVLNGDGLSPVPPFISWQQLAIACLLGILLIGAVVAGLRSWSGRRLLRVHRP